MKKVAFIVFSATCLLVLFIPHTYTQDSSPKQKKIFSGSETPFTMKVGDEFVLTLESNPSTGYLWQLAERPDENVVRLVGSEYKAASDAHRVGAGGNEVWTFRATGKGRTAINLIYVRPWEKDVPPARTATAMIIVD